ncbi:MAG: hypothetical protein GY820_40390 [Gammaproteobacteria bacterium]|nr:hypothetical protein [Gammaproteobacteria bacterium]
MQSQQICDDQNIGGQSILGEENHQIEEQGPLEEHRFGREHVNFYFVAVVTVPVCVLVTGEEMDVSEKLHLPEPTGIPQLAILEDIPTPTVQFLHTAVKKNANVPLPRPEDLVVDEFRMDCLNVMHYFWTY